MLLLRRSQTPTYAGERNGRVSDRTFSLLPVERDSRATLCAASDKRYIRSTSLFEGTARRYTCSLRGSPQVCTSFHSSPCFSLQPTLYAASWQAHKKDHRLRPMARGPAWSNVWGSVRVVWLGPSRWLRRLSASLSSCAVRCSRQPARQSRSPGPPRLRSSHRKYPQTP